METRDGETITGWRATDFRTDYCPHAPLQTAYVVFTAKNTKQFRYGTERLKVSGCKPLRRKGAVSAHRRGCTAAHNFDAAMTGKTRQS